MTSDAAVVGWSDIRHSLRMARCALTAGDRGACRGWAWQALEQLQRVAPCDLQSELQAVAGELLALAGDAHGLEFVLIEGTA